MFEVTGIYLNEFPIKGILINKWKTLNRDDAYRVKLKEPQLFFGSYHNEVILVGNDLIEIKEIIP